MTTNDFHDVTQSKFPMRNFILTCFLVSIWVNISEVFRYFVFVMPMTRENFAIVSGIAPMNLPVFLVWGVWDTILVIMTVLMYWLYTERFGKSAQSVVISATLTWSLFFVLFWLGLWNMRLTQPTTAVIALPLAWIEMVIACFIARECFRRFTSSLR
jgi:hypothetical protein